MNLARINELARMKSGGIASMERQWVLALQRMASCGLPDEAVERLVDACTGPTALSRLARVFSGGAVRLFGELEAACDGSTHDFSQWVQGLDVLYRWLEAHSRDEPLEKSLGYLSCCSAGEPGAKLPWVVGQMLEQYGMDR